MTDIRSYDWFALDRKILASIFFPLKQEIVGKRLTPTEFTKKIRRCIRESKIPINVKTIYDTDTEKNWAYIGGEYWSFKDKKNQRCINIIMHYNINEKHIRCSWDKFKQIAYGIADTVLHEIMHIRQYRRRNFKYIPGYNSFAESARARIDQEYYGHNDELDAHSFNIACALREDFAGNKKEIVRYINSDLRDDRLKKTVYRKFLKAFDFDHNHKIIKKLKKKIIYYLPYAELGKPYKTSDWLKN